MTACAIEPTAEDGERDPEEGGRGTGEDGDRTAPAPLVITANGAYAARLALRGDCWFPERWTLDGPEPYAVPLPGNQPEEPGTQVQPMADGQVLIHRRAAGRHTFTLLYPTGPGTGEHPLGAIDHRTAGTGAGADAGGDAELRLLPPAPCGTRAYALLVGRRSSALWRVAGGASGPERVAEVPGRCSGGVWLDRAGRMLALDRETGGRTKAVVVDLGRGGEVSPLLQIADGSDDRLLLADPYSGLLLIGSDAPSPGEPRLGWGVLGSTLPVRFPESLRLPGCTLTPFAVQPGQVLLPESCAVALRVDGPLGTWVGTWRPADRRLRQCTAPEGWLTGSGLLTADGELRLPYATPAAPCGVARVPAPEQGPAPCGVARVPAPERGPEPGPGAGSGPGPASPGSPDSGSAHRTRAASGTPAEPSAPRPVPLQQAPLARLVTN
ncbi:hypothetical protein [Streptomyces galbus]|uniref:Uncharacterized protein n=1 Tax=Streptomyces galbus TaxID=33898 RepID=A0A4U5X2I9_STRGB|nr:hypothetical protein [Streptomyces galbus]TKT09249.1 hypothetical protein E4U92_11305 [Streptomyces galbus]GHD29403.1 hypothetical protein GCM10010335_18160 [Streptomyces galbus]